MLMGSYYDYPSAPAVYSDLRQGHGHPHTMAGLHAMHQTPPRLPSRLPVMTTHRLRMEDESSLPLPLPGRDSGVRRGESVALARRVFGSGGQHSRQAGNADVR